LVLLPNIPYLCMDVYEIYLEMIELNLYISVTCLLQVFYSFN